MGSVGSFIPLIAIFVIFYFLLIRPQQKKQQAHQKMLKHLKEGDRVVTSGGLYGTITKIREEIIFLEVARVTDQQRVAGAVVAFAAPVRVKVSRSAIATRLGTQEAGEEGDRTGRGSSTTNKGE